MGRLDGSNLIQRGKSFSSRHEQGLETQGLVHRIDVNFTSRDGGEQAWKRHMSIVGCLLTGPKTDHLFVVGWHASEVDRFPTMPLSMSFCCLLFLAFSSFWFYEFLGSMKWN